MICASFRQLTIWATAAVCLLGVTGYAAFSAAPASAAASSEIYFCANAAGRAVPNLHPPSSAPRADIFSSLTPRVCKAPRVRKAARVFPV